MDGSQIAAEETWSVGGRSFRSRLIIGTGKYKDYAVNAAAAEAAQRRDGDRGAAPG